VLSVMSNSLKVSDMEMPPADRSLSASTTGKRTHLRRWAISIALALLLHGVIAVAVLLTWQKSTTPLHPNGPVIVELPPPPAEPAAPLGEAVPAPPKAGIERPSAAKQIEASRAPGGPPKRTDEISENKVASIGEERAEPSFATQSLAATAPLQNAEGENGADVRTATGGGGGVRSAVSSGEAAGGPIDTRFGPGSNKASRTLAPRKPIIIGRAAKDAGMQGRSRHLSAQAGVVINAIGARVPDRVSAAARANSSQEGAKNAIGSNVANLAGSISPNAADLPVTNAIGIAVRARPSIPGPVIAEPGAGAIAFAGGANAMPKAAINGTGMSHVGLGAGVIGGPAKNVAGVLNGTSFRPRHP
jgi:hypothetical protein